MRTRVSYLEIQRSPGKEGNARFANEGHWRFFSIAFGLHCGRWKARYASERCSFSLVCHEFFLKVFVSICHSFRSTPINLLTNCAIFGRASRNFDFAVIFLNTIYSGCFRTQIIRRHRVLYT